MSESKINHETMVANGLRSELAEARKRIAEMEAERNELLSGRYVADRVRELDGKRYEMAAVIMASVCGQAEPDYALTSGLIEHGVRFAVAAADALIDELLKDTLDKQE